MRRHTTLSQLDSLAVDLGRLIRKTLKKMELYLQEPESIPIEQSLRTRLEKLRGIFHLIELPAARQLVDETLAMLEMGYENFDEADYKHALAVSWVTLERYTEIVETEGIDYPEILLTDINRLRNLQQKTPLREGEFVCAEVSSNVSHLSTKKIADAERRQIRRLRKMYHLGLIGLLRDHHNIAALQTMRRSLLVLQRVTCHPVCQDLWIAAAKTIHAFENNGLFLTADRLKLFSTLDRQLKLISRPRYQFSHDDRHYCQLLMRQFLYLLSLCHDTANKPGQLLRKYDVPVAPVNDEQLQTFLSLDSHVTASDIGQLKVAMRECLDELRASLPQYLQSTDNDFQTLLPRLNQLRSLFKLLGRENAMLQCDLALQIVSNEHPTKNQDPMRLLNLTLAKLGEQIDNIRQSDTFEEDASPEYLLRNRVQSLFKEISLQIDELYHSKASSEQLSSINNALQSTVSALSELGNSQLHGYAKNIKRAFEKRFVLADDQMRTKTLPIFAELLACLEYLLEQPDCSICPPDRIYEVIQDGLNQLAELGKLAPSKGQRALSA